MTSTDLASKEVETATPRTKKAARALGYLNHDEWLRRDVVPRRDAVPLVVKGEDFFRREDCEEVLPTFALLPEGLWPAPEAGPVVYKRPLMMPASKRYYGPLYRMSDVRPLPERGELLDAIRRVSREVDNYSRPPGHDEDDETPLALVDRGISYAWGEGHLMFRGRNRNIGGYSDGLCDYRSTIIPESVVRVHDLDVFELTQFRPEPPEWEAPSLEDARNVLRGLPPAIWTSR